MGESCKEVNWKLAEKMPFKLEGFSTIKKKNLIYFFGGVDQEMNESGELYQFNINNNQFIKLEADKPIPGRSNCSISYYSSEKGNFIFIFGGLNCQTGWLNDCWKGEINETKVKWSKVKNDGILTGRDKSAVAQNESSCFIIGGFGPQEIDDDSDNDSDDEIKEKSNQNGMNLGWFDEIIKFNFENETFESLTWKGFEGAAGKAASCCFYFKNSIYIFGGRSPTGRSDKLLKFDLDSLSWEEEKPGGFIPAARSFASGTIFNNSIIIFGGTDRSDDLIGGLHQFQDGKWKKIETNGEFVTPRRQAAIHVDENENILLFGGVVHVDPATGDNIVSDEIWNGKIEKTNSARVDLASELGLKRK
jgi:hypothetical protein